VYEYQVDLYENVYYDFDLTEITNGDLDNNQYAYVEVLGITDDSQINGAPYLFILYTVDSFNAQYQQVGLAQILDLGTDISFLQVRSAARHLYEKNMNHKLISSDGDFLGTLRLSITAEFTDMDTGYIEEGFEFCVEEGVNLTSFPCENDVALTTTFPQEALNNISSIVGQGEATINNNGQFYGSLQNLKASKGYWIISNSAFCYNYTCAEN